MPQMAPMLWLFLFFYFIVVFMLFISNFYFSYCPSKDNVSGGGNSTAGSFSWQW